MQPLPFANMSLKVIVLACLLAAAQAQRPYLGLNLPFLEGRITGGKDALKGEFPHQVSLRWSPSASQKPSHFCGGSIINPRWILTAGHCVLAVPTYGQFVVFAGKVLQYEKEPSDQSAVVEKSYVHEKYPGNVAPYDIALLKLKTPLKLNADVKPIPLPKPNSLPNATLILSGWGSVSTGQTPSYPNNLQKVNLTVIDLKTCKRSIEALTGDAPVHETNVCTGPLTGGISACSGDSGGPLIGKRQNGSEVVGIVSWGIIPCGTRGAPSVYTRVSAFIDWIEDIIVNGS